MAYTEQLDPAQCHLYLARCSLIDMTCTAGKHVFPASPLYRLRSFPILNNALFLANNALKVSRIVSTKKVFSKKNSGLLLKIYPPAAENVLDQEMLVGCFADQ